MCQYGEFLIKKDLEKISQIAGEDPSEMARKGDSRVKIQNNNLAIYFLVCEDLIKLFLEDPNVLFEETSKPIEFSLSLIRDLFKYTPLLKLIDATVTHEPTDMKTESHLSSRNYESSSFYDRHRDDEDPEQGRKIQITDLFSSNIFQIESLLEFTEAKNLVYYCCTLLRLI